MKNGYDYVYILNEGEAKHLGGVAQAQFSINSDYFKDKYVILFDDVITSGRSMENFKRLGRIRCKSNSRFIHWKNKT